MYYSTLYGTIVLWPILSCTVWVRMGTSGATLVIHKVLYIRYVGVRDITGLYVLMSSISTYKLL